MKPSWRSPDPESNNRGDEDYDYPQPDVSRTSRSGRKIVPFLIFALFALFILKEQVPAVDDKIQSLLHPHAFAAITTCREAALESGNTPDFNRLLKTGRANPTQNGFFVDRLIIGTLEKGHGEVQYSVECYVDANGAIVDIQRKQSNTSAPAALLSDDNN